jgi:hypothetical protein
MRIKVRVNTLKISQHQARIPFFFDLCVLTRELFDVCNQRAKCDELKNFPELQAYGFYVHDLEYSVVFSAYKAVYNQRPMFDLTEHLEIFVGTGNYSCRHRAIGISAKYRCSRKNGCNRIKIGITPCPGKILKCGV